MNVEEYKVVLAQLYIIINRLNREIYVKIPKNLIDFIKDNRDKEYYFKYDSNKSLNNQNIEEETKCLMSGIYLNYCADETEKKRLLAICGENEKKHQEEIQKKYALDNIFKSKSVKKEISKELPENMYPIEIKKLKWYKKLFSKLLNIFRKK